LLFLLIGLHYALGGSCPGLCQDTSESCDSDYQPGMCPGGSNIQCCEMATPNCGGQCQDNSLPCSNYASGLCPGPDNVECCEGSGPTPPAPPPSGNGSCAPFANQEWNCADPQCTRTVCTGCGQSGYQCAEFVARTLASAGLIPLGPYDSQNSYGSFQANGNTYDLLWVSSKNGGIKGLEDYLRDSSWVECGADASCVNECSALMVTGSEGAYSHTCVGIAPQIVDAHNVARYQVAASFYHINDVWNPPSNVFEIVARQKAERAKLKIDPNAPYKKPTYKGI